MAMIYDFTGRTLISAMHAKPLAERHHGSTLRAIRGCPFPTIFIPLPLPPALFPLISPFPLQTYTPSTFLLAQPKRGLKRFHLLRLPTLPNQVAADTVQTMVHAS